MPSQLIVIYDSNRASVTVTPQSTFLDITKHSILIFSLDSSKHYRLKYKRSILDPSMQVRFSSVPANATLYLTEHNIAGTLVKIALQLTSGRIVAEHPSNRYLADVLKCFETADTFQVVHKNGSKISVPELQISGKSYGIEEWRGMRVDDVADSNNGLLIRPFWKETVLTAQEIEQILSSKYMYENENIEQTLSDPSSIKECDIKDDSKSGHAVDSSAQRPVQIANREFRFIEVTALSGTSMSSEDSFELSSAQLKQLAEDAKNKTKKLQDAPLVSKRAFEARRRADLLASYPTTLIRLKLLDKQQVVEAQFRSDELGEKLYEFAGQFGPFECLLSAGKQVGRDCALVDQGLFPKAVIIVHTRSTKSSDIGKANGCCYPQ